MAIYLSGPHWNVWQDCLTLTESRDWSDLHAAQAGWSRTSLPDFSHLYLRYIINIAIPFSFTWRSSSISSWLGISGPGGPGGPWGPGGPGGPGRPCWRNQEGKKSGYNRYVWRWTINWGLGVEQEVMRTLRKHIQKSQAQNLTLEILLFCLGFLFPPLFELSLKAIQVMWGSTMSISEDTVSCGRDGHKSSPINQSSWKSPQLSYRSMHQQRQVYILWHTTEI